MDILWPRWVARIGVTRATQARVLTADRQCTELPLLRLPRLVQVTGGGRVRSFQRFCAASPTSCASACAWVSPLSRRALERVRGSFGEDAPLARASWSAEEGDGGAGGGGVGGGSGGGSGGDP